MSKNMRNSLEYVPPPVERVPLFRRLQTTTVLSYVWLVTVLTWLRVLSPVSIRSISRLIELAIVREADLRKVLAPHMAKVDLLPVSRSHTHQKAAQLRNSCREFLVQVARQAGFDPYVVRKVSSVSYGSRYFFRNKDLMTPYADDKITHNSAFIMVDADYYCDMNKWLHHYRPIMMLTFAPSTAAGRSSDTAFHIENDNVVFSVSGGSTYRHRIWDYNGDTVSVVHPNGDLLLFHVEQRTFKNDPNRRLVWLLPAARVHGSIWRWNPNLETHGLKRREFLNSSGHVMVYDPVKGIVSIAANGSDCSVELSARCYLSINKRLQHKTTPLLVSDVERLLKQGGHSNPTLDAPILYELVGELIKFTPNFVRTSDIDAHFLPLGSLDTEDGKMTGAVVGNNLVTQPSIFPMRGVNSDEATVKGRIELPRNNKVPPPTYKLWASEFVSLLVPQPEIGAPRTPMEVYETLDRPLQKARFNATKHLFSTESANRLQAFIKSEPYANVTDPRNITTMDPENTTMLSTFTQPFKDNVLKKTKWYGPARRPLELIKRLNELALTCDELISTDFSRFDGTISQFLQENIVQSMYLRWVSHAHRPELKKLLDGVFMRKGRTAFGVEFDPGYGTRSGSAITTDGNTPIGAFVQFCALRKLGYNKLNAWDKIALVYGDDGVAPNLHGRMAGALESVAVDLGLALKSEVVRTGKPFPFLGRYFVDPWSNSIDSFADPMRTIGKLHLTSNRGVTPEQALVNKACGYMVTDRMTPIVGSWCAAVLCSRPEASAKSLTHDEQHRVRNPWPQVDKERILEACATVLDILPGELRQLDDLVASSTPEAMPVLFDTEVAMKIPAVFQGELVGPGVSLNTITTVIANPESCSSEDERPFSTSIPDSGRNSPGTPSTSDPASRSGNSSPLPGGLPDRNATRQSRGKRDRGDRRGDNHTPQRPRRRHRSKPATNPVASATRSPPTNHSKH